MKSYKINIINSEGFAFEVRCAFIDKLYSFFTSHNLIEKLGEDDSHKGYNYYDINDICIEDDENLYTLF